MNEELEKFSKQCEEFELQSMEYFTKKEILPIKAAGILGYSLVNLFAYHCKDPTDFLNFLLRLDKAHKNQINQNKEEKKDES